MMNHIFNMMLDRQRSFAMFAFTAIALKLPIVQCTECNMEIDGACLSVENEVCGLYLAESAIPNSGLGMFTNRHIPANERIFYGDVVVNIEDIEVNMRLRNWFMKKFERDYDIWILDHYFWNPTMTLSMHEAEDIQSIVPGLGMLANSHTGLVNAILKPPTRTTDLHRGKDPGAGLSTTFHDVHFVTERGSIEKGAELYVEYTDSWFEDRTDLGMVPLSHDFEKADELLRRLVRIQRSSASETVTKQVWDLLSFAIADDERLRNALPTQYEDIARVQQMGTANNTVPNRVRSPEWLEKNGLCIDNIRPGPSTLPQAGSGAFATRRLPKGSIVSPLPMVQLLRHQMEVYDADDIDDPDSYVWRSGTQQFLNYCYSHPKSSLLLFPYAPVVNYINHDKTNANVELRWSKHVNHRSEWLSMPPKSVVAQNYAGLMMELVATRDIREGDEIFLDYGHGWESSWIRYRDSEWQPDEEDRRYKPAAVLDHEIDVLKTEKELEDNPYGTVLTTCTIGHFDETLTNRPGTTVYAWNSQPDMYNNSDYMHPCKIIERLDGTPTRQYKVQLPSEGNTRVFVEKVPREAIQFFDEPYTSDMFLRETFRHEIWIPDEIFPAAWLDL